MTDAVSVRLLFVDEGAYHDERVALPRDLLDRYERLIDCLREEPAILKRIHIDLGRLCAAFAEEEGEEGEEG